jgi:hypothetical protein
MGWRQTSLNLAPGTMNGMPFSVRPPLPSSTSFIASANIPGFEFKLFTNKGSSAFCGNT